MKTKLFLSALVITGMVFTTSCSKDEDPVTTPTNTNTGNTNNTNNTNNTGNTGNTGNTNTETFEWGTMSVDGNTYKSALGTGGFIQNRVYSLILPDSRSVLIYFKGKVTASGTYKVIDFKTALATPKADEVGYQLNLGDDSYFSTSDNNETFEVVVNGNTVEIKALNINACDDKGVCKTSSTYIKKTH